MEIEVNIGKFLKSTWGKHLSSCDLYNLLSKTTWKMGHGHFTTDETNLENAQKCKCKTKISTQPIKIAPLLFP